MQKNRVLRNILAAGFIFIGISHFIMPDPFLKIMPEFIPFKKEFVYLSGFFEILGGAGLLFKKVRKIAGWGLIALLIAVFPANISMAFKNQTFGIIPQWALWLRLPLQFLLTWLVWRAAELRSKKSL
jgi:uncharacterized membrane protein